MEKYEAFYLIISEDEGEEYLFTRSEKYPEDALDNLIKIKVDDYLSITTAGLTFNGKIVAEYDVKATSSNDGKLKLLWSDVDDIPKIVKFPIW